MQTLKLEKRRVTVDVLLIILSQLWFYSNTVKNKTKQKLPISVIEKCEEVLACTKVQLFSEVRRAWSG